MSATVDARIKLKHDTTENWNNAGDFIPMAGEVIVYDDYIKIGTGNAYVQDLAFVDEAMRELLLDHIRNQEIHTTLQEKLFWNNKINVDDTDEQVTGELEDETLILNRN